MRFTSGSAVSANCVRLVLFAGLLLLSAPTQAERGAASTFLTVEGRVLSLGSHEGEGDLELVTVALAIEGSSTETTQLMLAPTRVLDQIGLSVSQGDRLRARVFGASDAPAPVQFLQNLSQGKAVRLRTLHATPLWNAAGSWQGGPIRDCPGPRRHRHRYRAGVGPSR